jgi:hypothetical protein
VLRKESRWSRRVRSIGMLITTTLALFAPGCTEEGAGSIHIADPQAVRAKGDGAATPSTKPATAKQAAALKAEEEAAKKNPKLR